MKLSFNNAKFTGALKKHLSLLLGLCVLAVALLEALVIKRSVDMVLQLRSQVPNVQTRIVRVNNAAYADIEKIIESGTDYQPDLVTVSDPFGQPQAK